MPQSSLRPLLSRARAALVCVACAAWASASAAPPASDLPERLAQHPALAARSFESYPSGPFVLYVERTGARSSADTVAALVLPALEALAREVAAAVEGGAPDGEPLALVLCADALTPRWFLLASGASFEAAVASNHDPRLRAVVRHWDSAGSQPAPDDTLRLLLRDACAALLAQRARGAPASPWLAHGLSTHLAERALTQSRGHQTTAPLPIDARRLGEVHALLADLPRRLAWWDSLPVVLAAPSREAYAALHRDARGWSHAYALDDEAASLSFELQAALFVAYLYDGASPDIVARMPSVAAAGLTDRFDALGLLERLEVPEFAALEGGAEAWLDLVFAQRAGLAPAAALSPTATLPEPEALARGRTAGLAAHFDRARLLPPPTSFDELAAEALWLGTVGRFADAACVLEVGAARTSDGEARGYLERERARMLQLGAARAAWLEHALSGGKVRLPIAGRFALVRIELLEGAALRLAESIDGQSYVPLTALDARTLGRNLVRADARGVAPAWVGGYALLLAGERGWRDAVRDELEGRSLQLDALVIEALRDRAVARGRVLALAASPHPRDAAELERAVAEIGALATGARARAAARDRSVDIDVEGSPTRDAAQLGLLRDFALRCLEERHAHADVGALLAGRSEALAGGALRLTYDFDGTNELADFVVDLEPSELPPTTGLTMRGRWFSKPSPVTRDDLDLALTGRVELRHRLQFAPPCRLLVELREPEYDGGATLAQSHTIVFAMLDGGEGGPTVRAVDRAGLVVRQGPVNLVVLPDQAPFPAGALRSVELCATLDGALRLTVDGREVQRTYTPELVPGAVRLLCRTPLTWTVRRLVLEGRPLAPSIATLRAAVVARDLERLGL